MNDTITFNGKPMPWQRVRGTGAHRFNPPAMTERQERIAWAFKQSPGGGYPIPDPKGVVLDLLFIFEPPRSWPKGKKRRALSGGLIPPPDVDNLAKLVIDALNGVAYTDDKQVVTLIARKKYGLRARTVLSITRVSEWLPEVEYSTDYI